MGLKLIKIAIDKKEFKEEYVEYPLYFTEREDYAYGYKSTCFKYEEDFVYKIEVESPRKFSFTTARNFKDVIIPEQLWLNRCKEEKWKEVLGYVKSSLSAFE